VAPGIDYQSGWSSGPPLPPPAADEAAAALEPEPERAPPLEAAEPIPQARIPEATPPPSTLSDDPVASMLVLAFDAALEPAVDLAQAQAEADLQLCPPASPGGQPVLAVGDVVTVLGQYEAVITEVHPPPATTDGDSVGISQEEEGESPSRPSDAAHGVEYTLRDLRRAARAGRALPVAGGRLAARQPARHVELLRGPRGAPRLCGGRCVLFGGRCD
jgi:hypothetical protein